MSEQLGTVSPGGADDQQPRPGDIVMLFRLEEGSECSPIAAHFAILAALRGAGLIPRDKWDTPAMDAHNIADFRERQGKLRTPVVRRYGQSGTWSP